MLNTFDPSAFGMADEDAATLGLSTDDREIDREAQRIWVEFWLHIHGVDYIQQGYHDGNGVIAARKVDEHTLVQSFYNRAKNEMERKHGLGR